MSTVMEVRGSRIGALLGREVSRRVAAGNAGFPMWAVISIKRQPIGARIKGQQKKTQLSTRNVELLVNSGNY